MPAGLAFDEMLSQYPRSAFQGFCRDHQRGQQQFATQTLRVHLLGIECTSTGRRAKPGRFGSLAFALQIGISGESAPRY